MSLTQPLIPTDPFGSFRDYAVFVPPKPRLQLPRSLYSLKIDLSHLWLTRTLRKPPPKQPNAAVDLRARTPVFTRPPPDEPPKLFTPPPSASTHGHHPSSLVNLDEAPVPSPIKLPELLPFNLRLEVDDEVYNWEDQPSVVLRPMGNIDTASPRTRERRQGPTCGVRYASPLLPSPTRDTVRPSDTVFKHDWIGWGGCFLNLEDSDSSDDEDGLIWPSFSCDEAYLGDIEDSCSDSEDDALFAARSNGGAREIVDCFAWLDEELDHLFEKDDWRDLARLTSGEKREKEGVKVPFLYAVALESTDSL